MNQATDEQWRAGMAKVDITPPLGTWMMGFGARTHEAVGIYDHLYATAMVLSNSDTKIAVVSCDLLALDFEYVKVIRTRVADLTDIPAEHVMVHTTHTHAGPLVGSLQGFGTRDLAYESVLFRQIVSAVVLANQRLEPAHLTFGVAHARVGVNRRAFRNGAMQIGEAPEGYVDDRVAAMGIWRAGNGLLPGQQLLGSILWAIVHPVVLGGGNYLISRDIPGKAIDHLEAAFPGSINLYLSGPCGNINPRQTHSPNRLISLQQHGTALAGAGLQALATGRVVDGKGLYVQTEMASIPLMPLPSEAEVSAMAEQVKQSITTAGTEVEAKLRLDYRLKWAEAALASIRGESGAEKQKTAIEVELQLMILGDVAFTTLPFEAFAEYQSLAEATSPVKDSLVIAYANGDFGYLFTEEAFHQGGYEVTGAFQVYGLQRFAAQAPTAVTEAIKRLHVRVATNL